MKKLLACIFIATLTIGLTAMDFLPMRENISHQNKNGYLLNSNFKDHKTTISDPDGHIIWSLTDYIGVKKPILSPNGEYLILLGQETDAPLLRTSLDEKEPIITIYKAGERYKEISIEDIYRLNIKEIIEKHELAEYGGGWVGLDQIINIEQFTSSAINWNKHQITIELLDKTSKTISF